MSATEQQHTPEPAPFDPTSSVEISVNAKGAHQWRVKVRAVSNIPQDVQEAYDLAVKLDDGLVEKFGVPK